MAGISVDRTGRNAAMVAKLALPFPLLPDPGGTQAIKPYGAWDEGNPFARPAVVIVAPGRSIAFRQVGEDFADRLNEDGILAALGRLGLPPGTQDPPEPGRPDPGPRAADLAWLPASARRTVRCRGPRRAGSRGTG